ncbi:MAG: enoyl-CoA hydratase/isomerase family protein, partial [Desulfobacteraceae bacterium]|nr:enoyl-CoA hydratase/isomerase family protein [Desulfobacteraceae bacterium]
MNREYRTIKVDMRGRVALLTMDNPPVNQLSPDFSEELRDVITWAFQESEINAVVLTGTGKNFMAGADITQMQAVKKRDDIFRKALEASQFLNRIETGPKPVIAAINGHCLGAGLELAMACHYRVAARGAKLGQPEVQIGLIPGAGGTQRLPRLIGLPSALEMITTGTPITAEQAHMRGLVDEVVDQTALLE